MHEAAAAGRGDGGERGSGQGYLSLRNWVRAPSWGPSSHFPSQALLWSPCSGLIWRWKSQKGVQGGAHSFPPGPPLQSPLECHPTVSDSPLWPQPASGSLTTLRSLTSEPWPC